MKSLSDGMSKLRLERVRRLKKRGTVAPNFMAKLWGSKLLDEIEGSKAMMNKKIVDVVNDDSNEQDKRPLQMERSDETSVIGTDVEALFPSLPDIESAKVVQCAVQESDIEFNNVDYRIALICLRLVGGKDYLRVDP